MIKVCLVVLPKEDKMSDKQLKMTGVQVSKEEVIAALGRPSAQWERDSRKREFSNRLKRGEKDLGIAGIKGHGVTNKGYLGYLENSLLCPLGSHTGLVSEEESLRIQEEANAETQAEIETYRLRLAELEKSPEAIRSYIGDMQRWLNFLERIGAEDPEEQPIEELVKLARESNRKRDLDIEALQKDIESYTQRLKALGST
jgi:hypothetical protein